MQCRHNLNYWQFGDYLGIGAGAHGKISYPDRIERTVRRRHPNDYLALMQSQPGEAVERKTVAAEDLPFEFMMNALRLTDGVPAAMLQERTGVPAAKIMVQIETARQKGLLETDPTVFRPTEKGRLFLNDLLQCFYKRKQIGGRPGKTRPERVSKNMPIDGKRSRIPRRAFQTAQPPPEMSDA